MYPQSIILSKNKKIIKKKISKMFIFTAVKNRCILHGHVFVMCVVVMASMTSLSCDLKIT